MLGHGRKGDGFLRRAFVENGFCRWRLGDGKCGYTRLHYSGFMPGDFFDCVAEELDVVDP